jgi:hypothetical protein
MVLLVGSEDGAWADTVVLQQLALMCPIGHFMVAQHCIVSWSGTIDAMQSLH